MAGRSGRKGAGGERDAEAETIAALTQELAAAQRILARVDPQAVLARVAEPLGAYQDDLPGRVLALAAVGLFSAEIRAELGISSQQWGEWGAMHPEFAAAKMRALDLAQAHWHAICRRAIEAKDWKLPYANLLRMIADLSSEDAAQTRGDASRLVVYEPGALSADAPQAAQNTKISKAG